MMMSFYPVPGLAQLITTPPNAAWGTERLDRCRNAPILKVRRASDNALADCFSSADIVAHCAGTNGFVHTAFDQLSGAARDLTQTVNATQPKIFDSVTGLVKSGAQVYLQFTNTFLNRGDKVGLATGSPFIYSVSVFGAWTNGGFIWGIGDPGTSGTAQWNFTRVIATSAGGSYDGPGRTFTCANVATSRCFFSVEKALNANATAIVGRQNKAALVESSVIAGTLNLLAAPNAITNWGHETQAGPTTTAKSCFMGHWGTSPTEQDRRELEQYLDRMRLV